jgi:hypothetical protein
MGHSKGGSIYDLKTILCAGVSMGPDRFKGLACQALEFRPGRRRICCNRGIIRV